jgi:phospholipid/cholesterol/gamma-HCH transport system substrate-binding protein
MKRSSLETLLGAFVLCVTGYFLWYAYTSSHLGKSADSFVLTANFSKVDGIAVGADVKLNGIKIGTVTDMGLDPATFQAVISLGMRDDLSLPVDSTATITSEGLLGGGYVAISPGAEEETFKNGDKIAYTQGSTNLVDMLGKFIFTQAESKTETSGQEPNPNP